VFGVFCAAALLVKQGYEVIGVFLNHGVIAQISNTVMAGSRQDAMRVATKLGINLRLGLL